MSGFTLHELQCFDAVVRAGGFQAAATALHRSHPAVFAAVAKLERQLGVALLDRSGYRVQPTAAGASLQQRAQALLQEAEALQQHARQLAEGEEPQLRVVIGDLCPRPQVLALLGSFFAQHPGTRLHLLDEAIGGPGERLDDDEADLIVHRVDAGDARLETVPLGRVALLPVAAPGFLPEAVARAPTPARLRGFMQCVLRDTARRPADRSWYVIDGAPQCTVADQRTKRDVILQGLAWGHLPRFLIEDALRDGRLRPLAGRQFPGIVEDLAAARRRDRPHGPVAERLWRHIRKHAPALRAGLGARRP